jgi:hypothetical protein
MDVDFVSARTSADVTLLKPSPFLVTEAAEGLAVVASRCALIGDSVTDIQAWHAAQVVSVGYANKPSKPERFAAAGVDLIITNMGFAYAALLRPEQRSAGLTKTVAASPRHADGIGTRCPAWRNVCHRASVIRR